MMHPECMHFLKTSLISIGQPWGGKLRVLEFGSRDVNGSPRELFGAADYYLGVDIEPGPGADVVADAATFKYDGAPFDVVICVEVAEHTPAWRDIVRNAHAHLNPGGLFIFTAACDPREPHSAVNGELLDAWNDGQLYFIVDGFVADGHVIDVDKMGHEYYQNISPIELYEVLADAGFSDAKLNTLDRGDVQATAIA